MIMNCELSKKKKMIMNCDNLNQPGTDTCHPSFIDFLSHHLDCDCINVTLPPSLPFSILHTHFLTPHRYIKKKHIHRIRKERQANIQ